MKQSVATVQKRLKRIEGESHGHSKHGLYGVAVMTHKEVAFELGISKARVQQIERMAFWKIRHRMANEIREMKA